MTTEIASPASIFGEEDERIERALDVERFNRASVYNHAGFRPVRNELSHAPVRVTGTIPRDLEGLYIRNGTNPQFDRTHVRYHVFNGAGILHQIQILNGEATYAHAYVRTPRFLFEQQAGREVFVEFSDVAGGGRAGIDKIKLVEEKKRKGAIPNLSSLETVPGSTSIQYHHGALYCLQESGYAFVLNARREGGRLVLDGRGRLENWGGRWQGPFSAHPRVDPSTGDFYNLSADSTGRILAGHITQGALHRQAAVHEQTAETGRMGYLHDFYLTENYLVFPDISIRIDQRLMAGETGSCFFFDPSYQFRWGVLPRSFRNGDTVRWFDAGMAGSIWHVVNGWERRGPGGGSEIVLYAPIFSSYPSDLPIHTPEEPPAKLHKFVLDLESGKVIEKRQLLDHGYERPSLNLGYVGAESRYAYLLDEERAGYMGKGALKYDLINEREVAYFDYGDFFGGEPLFVPKADASSEDDGYLLDLLMTGSEAELLILHAQSMEQIARLHLPQRVPFGVHACWLDQQKVEQLTVMN